MTRILLLPVYPSFLFIFQEEKIIAEIKKWNSKYCILISDSCFQWLHADRKFWSRRYFFPHLCIYISDNTGYPDREFFFLIQEERDSFKELIAKKDQLNRMQRSVAETFQEVIELTGSLCFMFRSTPRWTIPTMQCMQFNATRQHNLTCAIQCNSHNNKQWSLIYPVPIYVQ